MAGLIARQEEYILLYIVLIGYLLTSMVNTGESYFRKVKQHLSAKRWLEGEVRCRSCSRRQEINQRNTKKLQDTLGRIAVASQHLTGHWRILCWILWRYEAPHATRAAKKRSWRCRQEHDIWRPKQYNKDDIENIVWYIGGNWIDTIRAIVDLDVFTMASAAE